MTNVLSTAAMEDYVMTTTDDVDFQTRVNVDISVGETALTVSYIVLGSIGFIGNVLVAAVLLRAAVNRKTKKTTSVFIVNQSVIDSLTALFLILTTVIKHDGRHLEGVADDIFCRVWLSKVPIWSLIMSSTYNLVAVTIERYLKIVHPIFHRVHLGNKAVAALLVTAWLIGFAFNVPYDIIPSGIENGKCNLFGYWKSQKLQNAAGLLQVILQYFLPMLALGYCYSHMAYVLHKKSKIVAPAPAGRAKPDTEGSAEEAGAIARLRKLRSGRSSIIKTLAIVFSAFVICSSWNQWFFLFYNIGILDYRAFNSQFYHFSVVALFANCCANPLIYTFKYKAFKDGVKDIFCRVTRSNELSTGRITGTVTRTRVS